MRSFDGLHIDIEALRPRNPDLQEEIFDRVITNLYLNLKKAVLRFLPMFLKFCITLIFANKRSSSLAKVVENYLENSRDFLNNCLALSHII